MDTIVTRLRQAREQAGVTLAELAKRTGYAVPTLSGVENGHDEPSRRLLQKWIEALQLNEIWVRTGQGAVFHRSNRQLREPEQTDLGVPLRSHIRSIRQQAVNLLDEIDKLESELEQSRTKGSLKSKR